MRPSDLLPARIEDDNALRSLLNRVVDHDEAGSVIGLDLLVFGFLGSLVVIFTALVALILPEPESIRQSSFYLVLGGAVASLTGLMKALAIPALIAGVSLLVLDLFLMKVRTSEHSRSVIVIQAAMGGTGGALCTIFLALALLNLVLWIIIVTLFLMAIGVMLAGIGSG